MYNKNKFRSFLLAKRISYAGLTFSVATFIISIIMVFVVLFYKTKITYVLAVVRPYYDPYTPARNYMFKVLFPSMIISSIFGIIFFSSINLILSKRLKILDPVFSQKEFKQNLDSFKLQRIQDFGYLF